MALPDSSIPLGEWSGSTATRELMVVLKEIDRRNALMTKWMIVASVVQVLVGLASMTLAILALLWRV
jgi:hypothetical protein